MDREIDREFSEAIEIGQANKEIITLAHNWCAHLSVESHGGVGMVEQATGLPIGMRRIVCPYARAAGMAGMDMKHIAIDFYERNCADCKDRKPVRLPNLLQLVQEKAQEQQAQAGRARRAAQIEAAGVESRTTRRLSLREGRDGATSHILDILDRLDRDPKRQEHEILVETARGVGDKFDEQIQEALFELADAGGWIRTEAAIEALCIVSRDHTRLAGVALKALARGEAIHTAGILVSKHLDRSHEPLVTAAMPTLIYLASPVSGELGIPGRPGDDEPLLASYRLFPGIARDVIAAMLRSPDKSDRIHACHAIVALIGDDPGLVPALASSLIASLQLPDDHYGREGSASHAVARTFAWAMRFRPDEVDSILQQAIAAASSSDRDELFSAYEEVLRFHPVGSEHPVTESDRLAFRRIVDVLAQRPRDSRFRRAGSFARGLMRYHPSLVDAHADVLLGAAVLIAGDLASPYSPLLDPRPDPVKAMEEQTRTLELTTALDALSEVVGASAGRNPKTAGRQLVQTLEHLGDDHARLRAALLVSLGIMGQSRDGLAIALPSLYTAMMDSAVGVRAAGATAYSELASDSSDDLPDLIHQSFLLLLADPYVAVHWAAVRALRRVNLPERFLTEALQRVAIVMIAYAKDRSNDEFLAECIEQFVRLSRQTNTLTAPTLRLLVDILDRMGPSEAAHFVVYHGRQFRGTPGYAKLVVKLLADPGAYDFHLGDLAEELGTLSVHEVAGLDNEIQTAWKACLDRGVDLTDELLEILTAVGAWNAAVELSRQARLRLDDTRWNRPRKLYATAREVAAGLEHAASIGDTAAIISATSEWRRIRQEIERDDEENAEARNPLRGLRLPSEDQ